MENLSHLLKRRIPLLRLALPCSRNGCSPALVPSRDEFTMKLYLINDAHDPLVRKLFHEEIERHQEKHQYLKLRWQQLFQSDEYRRQHYGHALILEQAIQREQQRLNWLRHEYENLPAQ
ncbi:MAG: hypothetical protein KBI24_02565 [Selenomonas sp.]|nr:hypothetical protein [Selenomonas sp.]